MEEENTTITEEIISGEPIKFTLLLIIEILSLICTLWILIYLFLNWEKMITKGLRNHFILSLVSITFLNLNMDLPFTISYYRLGYDEYHTISFCVWWYWLDYTLIIISIFLTAAASIQRHILIFNAHWFHQCRRRWFLHFIPIIFCLFYPGIFYFIVMIIHPCDYSNYEYTQSCYAPCYTEDRILFNLDWILNTAFPLVTIILANITLIIRVIRSMKRTRQRQVITWKRQRKLTLQLFFLSSLFVLGWTPSTILAIVQSSALPTLLEDIPSLDYISYLTYFVCPLQPFICVLGLPELTKSSKNFLRKIFSRAKVTPVQTI